ncbi:MAG: hypothetical protein ACKV22_04175 [Bryobacteraceae bacterium]
MINRREFSQTLGFGALAAGAAASSNPIDIGTRRELMVDRFLIDRIENAELRLATPVDAGPVIRFDKPWEGRFCGYTTLIRDGEKFRMYYRGVPNAGQDGRGDEVTCLAESSDAIHWTRPELGLFPAQGTTANNLIYAKDPPFSHNFAPFLDTRPGVAESERYKAFAGTLKTGLFGFVSADGIRWRKVRETPVVPSPKVYAFDSQNLGFWSEHEQQYVCYYRVFKEVGGKRWRWIARTTSKDFLNWTPGEDMTFGDAPAEHLYTNQTAAYLRAPHLYVSICARFLPGRQVLTAAEAAVVNVDPGYYKDCSDAVLLTTRGGNRYDRTFLEAFLRPGLGYENWVSRSNYPAHNLLQTGKSEMSFYVNRNYGQPTAYLRRYTLRLDGFASAHAGYAGGEMISKPLRFSGKRLDLNYSTSAPGSVRVEIQDAAGKAIPGFSLEESRELVGDNLDQTYGWRAGSDVGALAGKTVRLRFVLKDADLYSFRFRS